MYPGSDVSGAFQVLNAAKTATYLSMDTSGKNITLNPQSGGTLTISNLTTGTSADVLCLTAGGNVILQAAASCTISTERIKEKMRPLTAQEALAAIEGLMPIEFKRKPEDGPLAKDPNFEAMQTGFSAENICAIEPRFCIVEPDGVTPHGYRPEAVLAALTAVVQAQQTRIRTLEGR